MREWMESAGNGRIGSFPRVAAPEAAPAHAPAASNSPETELSFPTPRR